MNRRDFQEAVWNGLGRAILYARENDVGEFQDIILDACLHCYSADEQFEGTRAPFMYDLVNLLPDREFYYSEVLKALPNCGDDWDAVQRFRLASYLAMDGNEGARRAMYENFHPGPRMVEQTGTDFVRMDGLDGFLFAAEKVGELLLANTKDVDQGWLLSGAIEALGEEATLVALRNATKINPRIEAYRLAAEASREKREIPLVTKMTYAEIKPRFKEPRRFFASLWGKHASDQDLELAARDMLLAQTPEEQSLYLRVFSGRPFPLDPGVLMRLAATDYERVSVAAAAALGNITHPAVRELAFRLVEARRPGRESAISMLVQNWEPGDHQIAISWFAHEEDRYVRHHLGRDLRNSWDTHPNPSMEPRMLLTIYEKQPCSFCRESAVSRLIELGSLPDSIREECAYDASEDIRGLIK